MLRTRLAERQRTEGHARDPAGEQAAAAARVLVADDDEEMRSLLAATLRRDGYEVLVATSGDDLLEKVRSVRDRRGLEAPIDALVTDIRMPGATGIEVLSMMRTADWSIPIVLITAFGDRETHEQAERLGADAVLDKPFDLDDLRMILLNLIPARR